MKRNTHRTGWGGQPAKPCGGCKKVRLLKFYAKNKGRWDGLNNRCKFCESARIKANLPQKNLYSRTWRRAHPHKVLEYELRHVYGLSLVAYESMLTAQGGVCAICQRPETAILRGREKRLAVDHCHASGIIRGLLCGDCNRGIGFLGDSTERLRAAINYLIKSVPEVILVAS